MMVADDWVNELPIAISVCDSKGILLGLNIKAIELFKNDGGENLIGKNILDCHSETDRKKLRHLLQNQLTNCYTLERNGIRKLIYQAPWYKDKIYMGFVELIIEIPHDIHHKIAD